MRTLRDARRARRPPRPRTAKELGDDMIEMAVAALLGALRRAGELADAIEARGGTSVVRYESHHLRRSDVVALSILGCVIVAIGLLA